MQLTDAEIREILIRRKREKKRRQKRRRRRTLIIILLIILSVVIFIKVKGISGSKDTSEKPTGYTGEIRGIIFIDPGHGGVDSGSGDDNGTFEKEDNLKISLAIRESLQALGFQVEMSRTEDKDVDRTKRGEMANKAGAQLFVSIHRNKAKTDGHGIEGFIPKKNDPKSRLLGENIMHALARAGFAERTIRAGTLNSADEDYEELAAAKMPAALMEIGFLSSAEDNALFNNQLERNAREIARAIDFTFVTLYEPARADEYKAQMDLIESTAAKVRDSTSQAAEGMNVAIEMLAAANADEESSDEEEAPETGKDPQAPVDEE